MSLYRAKSLLPVAALLAAVACAKISTSDSTTAQKAPGPETSETTAATGPAAAPPADPGPEAPPPADPAAPATPVATLPTPSLRVATASGKAALAWTLPAADPAVTGFHARYRATGAAAWQDVTATPALNAYAAPGTSEWLVPVSGLADGTAYEFVVAAVAGAAAGPDSSIVSATPKAPTVLVSESFDGLADGALAGQNGWVAGGGGTWVVEAGPAGFGKILSQTDNQCCGTYLDNYVSTGPATWTGQRVVTDFKWLDPLAYAPQIWLRATTQTGAGDGYVVYNVQDTWTIALQQNGTLASRASVDTAAAGFDTAGVVDPTDALPMTAGSWYTLDASVFDDAAGHPVVRLYVYPRGGARPAKPLLTYTFTAAAERFAAGYFALHVNDRRSAYDAVTVYDAPVIAAVEDLAAVAGAGAAALSWTAPNAGEPCVDVLVEFRETGATAWQRFTHPPLTGAAVSVTGLTPGTSYDVRVTPVQAGGLGTPSNVATATP